MSMYRERNYITRMQHGQIIERKCLYCGKTFIARGRFNRVCDKCKRHLDNDCGVSDSCGYNRPRRPSSN